MRKFHTLQMAILSGVVAGAMMIVSPDLRAEQLEKAEQSQENGFYATGSVQRIISASGSGVRESEEIVSLNGSSRYHGEYAADLAVGKEFIINRDENRPKHLRAELELFGGYVRRKSLDIGIVHASLNDRVDVRALFVNALYRVSSSEHMRWWLGAGLGYGQIRMPDASYLTSCGCFSDAATGGLAFRAKFQAERQISKSTALFAEAGYLHLPASHTSALLSVDYGTMNLTTLGAGLRTCF